MMIRRMTDAPGIGAQKDEDHKWEPEPRYDAATRGESGDNQRDDDARGHGPVISDDEVVPELGKPDDVAHPVSLPLARRFARAGGATNWPGRATRPPRARGSQELPRRHPAMRSQPYRG